MDVRQDKGMFRWNLQIGLRLCGIFVFGGSFRVLRINFLLLKVEDEFWMRQVLLNDLFSVSWRSRCLWREFLILCSKWNKYLSTYNIILHIQIILFYNQRSSFTQTLKHFTKKYLAFTKSSTFTSTRGPTNDFHE